MSHRITGSERAHRTGRLGGQAPPPAGEATDAKPRSPGKDSSSLGSHYGGYESQVAGGRGGGGGGTGGVQLDDEATQLAGGRGKGGPGTGGKTETPHEAEHGQQFAGGRGKGGSGTGGFKPDDPPDQMMG